MFSLVVSFLLARKFGSRIYVGLVSILIILVSFFSMMLPLSFPFHGSIYAAVGPGTPGVISELYFLTFEINRSIKIPGMVFLHYSFFLLVNLLGAILGYWTEKLFEKKVHQVRKEERVDLAGEDSRD